MSEDSAARRLQAAELFNRYPDILRPLILERRVHLSGLSLLYSLVTDDNAERLFEEAASKTRNQIIGGAQSSSETQGRCRDGRSHRANGDASHFGRRETGRLGA